MALASEREWLHVNDYAVRLLIVLVVFLAVAGAFWWQVRKNDKLQAQYHTLALADENHRAALDTTRLVALSREDSLKILGDTLRAVTHLVVQQTTKADALDKALGQVRVATEHLTAQVQALNVRAPSTADVVSVGDARTATFAIDTTPYHGTAAVTLPATGKGTIDLRLALDAAPLAVSLGCQHKDSLGIAAAAVTVVGPRWLPVVVNSSTQSPEVCNAVTPAGRRYFGAPDLVLGVGRVFSSTGSAWGAFVGIGAHVGP